MFRSFYFLLAILGIVLVVVLVLLRRDLVREGRTGPRWKRKLVAAGLVLLGMAGVTWDWSRSWEPGGGSLLFRTAGDPIRRGQRLEETKPWQHLIAVWHEAEGIAAGNRGDNPFDEANKNRLLDELTTAAWDLERLRDAGLLTAPDAGLLQKELMLLTQRVHERHSVEDRYRQSLARLTDRLSLLRDAAWSAEIRPPIFASVVNTVEEDIAVLQDDCVRAELSEARKAEADQLVQAAQSHLMRIKHNLTEDARALENKQRQAAIFDAWKTTDFDAKIPAGRDLTDTEHWKHLVAAWREAEETGARKQGFYFFDEQSKGRLLGELATAGQHLDQLHHNGLLTATEAHLLQHDLAMLGERVKRMRPLEHRRFTCYDMIILSPAQQSLDRLTNRLPLLGQLVKDHKVHPAAVHKTLGTVEADMEILAKKEEIERLKPEDRDRALVLRKSAETTITKIKSILEKPN